MIIVVIVAQADGSREHIFTKISCSNYMWLVDFFKLSENQLCDLLFDVCFNYLKKKCLKVYYLTSLWHFFLKLYNLIANYLTMIWYLLELFENPLFDSFSMDHYLNIIWLLFENPLFDCTYLSIIWQIFHLHEITHATELVLDRPGFSETFDLLDSTWLLQVVTSLS